MNGYDRKCLTSHSCDELARRIGLFDACIAARNALSDRCYKDSTDPGHPGEVAKEDAGRAKCIERQKEKGC